MEADLYYDEVDAEGSDGSQIGQSHQLEILDTAQRKSEIECKIERVIGRIVRSREFEGMRIKFMQSTLETARYSLAFQSEFLATHINNEVLELPRLKLATSAEGLTSQEKQ